MQFNKKTILTILLISLFIFLRFYKLNESFLFFGDTGRDYLVLFDALQNRKPPLLGPQTSALPFNQSAIYFYLLFPVFFLTNQSLFSSQITLSIFYIVLFLIGIKYLKKFSNLQNSLFIVFFLVSIHPQQIIQSRYVWNPSFITPCLLSAFYLFQILQKKFNKKLAYIFTFFLTLSTAFSYSTVPVLISFMTISIFIFRKKTILIYLYTILNLLLVNLPTIFFELRHHFLLTNMMLHQEKLPQSARDIESKLNSLNKYIISIDNNLYKIIILLSILLALYLTLRKFNPRDKNNYLSQSLLLLFLVFLIVFLSPFTIHAHYIFGILIFIFLSISFLDLKYSIPILFLITLSYLTKDNFAIYFSKAYRTPAQSLICAQKICQTEKEALFVSTQSGNHNYHDGVAYKYLLKRSGCKIKDLVGEIDQAKHMIVIVNNSQYEHGKTRYNELTQFGDSREIRTYSCDGNINVHILERI